MRCRSDRVGVIGLGLLGAAIVERLRAHGYSLLGHDKDPSRVNELGLEGAPSAAAVAEAAERIVLCLPDSRVVADVIEGDQGLLAASRPVRWVVDTTTGTPECAEKLAADLAAREIGYVDAAVSGSSVVFRRGEAVLLVGATDAGLEAIRDLLDSMASVIFHFGPPGSGLKAKLVTNLVLGLNRLALAEGLSLGEKLGMSAGALLEALRAGPAHSRALEAKGDKMASSDFTPQAKLSQHLKDVELILELARQAGAAVPLSHIHREVLQRGVESGHGEEDNAAVIEVLRQWRGP